MGVIDLDARVKKLEQGGGGGAEIDQIEADLTALEEQINGDGETDFGLAGDVSDIQADLVSVDLSSLLTGKAAVVTDAKLRKYGNVYEISILTDKTVATTLTSMVTLPVEARPTVKFGAAVTMLDIGDISKRAIAIVNTDGTVTAAPNQSLTNSETAGLAIHATWIVIPTT